MGARHRSPNVLCKALYVKRESPALRRWDDCDCGRSEQLEAASKSPARRRLTFDGRSQTEVLDNSKLRQQRECPGCPFWG